MRVDGWGSSGHCPTSGVKAPAAITAFRRSLHQELGYAPRLSCLFSHSCKVISSRESCRTRSGRLSEAEIVTTGRSTLMNNRPSRACSRVGPERRAHPHLLPNALRPTITTQPAPSHRTMGDRHPVGSLSTPLISSRTLHSAAASAGESRLPLRRGSVSALDGELPRRCRRAERWVPSAEQC